MLFTHGASSAVIGSLVFSFIHSSIHSFIVASDTRYEQDEKCGGIFLGGVWITTGQASQSTRSAYLDGGLIDADGSPTADALFMLRFVVRQRT